MANDYLPQIDCEKVITDVATSLIKDATGSAWDKIKSFFKDLDVKDQIRYGSAYNEYLTNVQAKYGKIKTLIYRHIPKDLYSFYECIGVKYSGKIVSTSSVNNLLSIGHKIIITGTGGIGKSILFKHLLLNSVKETNFIPVLIELRSFNSLDTKEISMHDAIYKILTSNGFCLDEKYLCNIIRMTCKLNCYSYQTAVSHEELEQELATRLVKYLKKSNRKIDECPISTAFELVNPKELLDVLKWFESQLLFSLSILEKNSDTSINRKRKLSSIIEEL